MSNKKSDYNIYTHSDINIDTMGDFVSKPQSIGVGLDIVKLLNYADELGTLNLDNLIALYSQDELTKFKTQIEAIRKNAKQIADNTTIIESSINQNPTQITVVNKIQQDASIIPKDPVVLNLIIADSVLYPESSLNDNQRLFINKISIVAVRKLFTKFILLVKAQTKYEVFITSSKRIIAEEQKLIKQGNKTIPANTKFSYHLAGLALDINLMLNGSIAVDSHSTKTEWGNTGILKISSALNLKWGGTFITTPYDPVHFDARNYYSVDVDGFLGAITTKEDVKEEDTTISVNENVLESNQNSLYADLPLHIGTILNLPLVELDRDVLNTENNQTIKTPDFESFLAKQLFSLLKDSRYEREFIPKKQSISQVKEIFPFISVWVWSRALSMNDLTGKTFIHTILNITPYVSALTTTVSESGGNFSIELSSVETEIQAQAGNTASVGNGWKISESTQKASTLNSGDYVNQSFLHYEQDGALKRSRFFFEKALQANDIVFIRFERLILEDKRQNLDSVETITVDQLPNQIFDMIGLIDSPSISTQPSNAAVSINIVGRDLIKLLIEDGVYFYPSLFTSGGIFANETGASNQRLNRFGPEGQITSRFQQLNKTIEKSLQYVMNSLGSIDICPTDLFKGYQNAKLDVTQPDSSTNIIDKRSMFYQLDDASRIAVQNKQQEIDDQKNEILSKIDKVRKKNNITSGTSIDVYNIIKAFLKERFDNKQIVETYNFQIQSWFEIINNKIINSRVPTVGLADRLFVNKRIWIDNSISKRPISFTDIDSQEIVKSVEDLFTKADKVKLQNHGLDLVLQLNRINQDSYSSLVPQYSVYILQNIIAQIQKDNEINTVIDDHNAELLFNENDLTSLVLKYKALKKKGKDIFLVILAKNKSELTVDELDIFNNIYSIIKKEGAEVPKAIFELKPMNGIWQIIKLVIDDSVKNRLLADASIGNEMGSLLNAIRKICQDPFCEFFTDTYGDQFYFIVRKKPFDKESILSMLEGRAIFETVDPVTFSSTGIDSNKFGSVPKNVQSLTVKTQNLIIDIDESDLISDALTYSTEAYSWYRIQLKNLISGSDSDMAFAYLKAIYFNEFADIFGSKPLDVTTNYIPYQTIIDKKQKLSNAYFIQQGTYDLKYLIESHAYLPFTRQGTITINGDRRIKRGTFIRLKSTNEIFYVDSVNHSFAIDESTIERTTSLQVSRGMVEKYIKGAQLGEGKNAVNISYFDICSLPIDDSVFSDQKKGLSDFNTLVLSKWKVNPVVFNFFIKKLQFAKDDNEVQAAGINFFNVKS